MIVYLVRHGMTESNLEHRLVGQSDSPLLPESHKTLESIGQLIADVSFDAFYVSPLGRTVKSYAALKLAKVKRVVEEPRLKELSTGDYEGRAFSQIPPAFLQELLQDGCNTPFPAGESYAQVQERLLPFIKEIKTNHEKQTIGILSHWGPNAIIAGELLGWDFAKWSRWMQPNNVVYKIEDKQIKFISAGWVEGQFITNYDPGLGPLKITAAAKS